MARTGVRIGSAEMLRSLSNLEKRIAPRAMATALNRTNGRIKTLTGQRVRAKYPGLSAKQARRSIVIPRFRRARPGQLRAGGFLNVVVPAIEAPGGRPVVFKAGAVNGIEAAPSQASVTFIATMPKVKANQRRRHRGRFFRAVGYVRGPREGNISQHYKRPDGQWTQLPIKELFSDVTPESERELRAALEQGAREWAKRFDSVMIDQLRRAGFKRVTR